ncbi:MAG: hypothetical protein RJB66_2655 [Pseudomonadota bacterium]|jgi:hypothetical protein
MIYIASEVVIFQTEAFSSSHSEAFYETVIH